MAGDYDESPAARRYSQLRPEMDQWITETSEALLARWMLALEPMNPYWIIVAITSVAQLIFFARWLHRRTRDDEIRRAFVRDMAVNHLPHIYQALRQIAVRLHIELKEPPPVQFLELNGSDRK